MLVFYRCKYSNRLCIALFPSANTSGIQSWYLSFTKNLLPDEGVLASEWRLFFVTLNPLIVCRDCKLSSRQLRWPTYRVRQLHSKNSKLGFYPQSSSKFLQFCWDQTAWVPPFLHFAMEFNTSNTQVQRFTLHNCPGLRVTKPNSQSPHSPNSQSHKSQTPRVTRAQTPRVTEPKFRSRSSPTVHWLILSLFSSNFLCLYPPTNRCPGRQTKQNGRLPLWILASVTPPWSFVQYCGPLLSVNVFLFEKDWILKFVNPMWPGGSPAILLYTRVDLLWSVTDFPLRIFTRSDSLIKAVATCLLWLDNEKLWRLEKLFSLLVVRPKLTSAI